MTRMGDTPAHILSAMKKHPSKRYICWGFIRLLGSLILVYAHYQALGNIRVDIGGVARRFASYSEFPRPGRPTSPGPHIPITENNTAGENLYQR